VPPQVRDAILSLGGIACAVEADITSPSAPARVVAESVSALGGRLDILVNNAGYTWDGTIHKMPGEQWDAMLAVHVTAPFRLIQVGAWDN
jgi:3-oxoacyl-[acyl-carrier protein] reductase